MFNGIAITDHVNFTYVMLVVSQLLENKHKICTSTLINPNVAVTAAHCFLSSDIDKTLFHPSKVALGLLNNSQNYQFFEVVDVYFHPQYKILSENDIAMVKSKQQFSVQFPPLTYEEFEGKDVDCVLVGYGATESDPDVGSTRLSYIEVVPMEQDDCDSVNQFDFKLICSVIGQDEGAPCHGDGGAPLICDGTVVGIVSRALLIGSSECGKAGNGIVFYEDLFRHRIWMNKITGQIIQDDRSPSFKHKTSTVQLLILISLITL